MQRNEDLCLVARSKTDGIVGVLIAGSLGMRGTVSHLAVAEGWRRQGIAAAMIDHVLGAFARRGILRVFAFTTAGNDEADSFWEDQGFADTWPEKTFERDLSEASPAAGTPAVESLGRCGPSEDGDTRGSAERESSIIASQMTSPLGGANGAGGPARQADRKGAGPDAAAGERQDEPAGTAAALRRGMLLALPLIAGYVPVAFAFGVLGDLAGLPGWAVIAMSLFVYAGASQFAALQMLGGGGSSALIVLTTFVINLRHTLLAASIAPRLGALSIPERAWFSLEMTDESYAVHESQYRRRPGRPKPEVFTLNVLVHCSWVIGTVAGVVVGARLGDPSSLGLDFALAAMFIAILVIDAVKTRHDVVVATIAGLTAVALSVGGMALWSTVVATTVAATVGLLIGGGEERV